MKNKWLVTIVIATTVGVTGFFGGMQYQKSKIPTSAPGARFGGSQNFQGQNRQFLTRPDGGRIVGEILSIDDTSITVKMPDGSSKIAILTDSTVYNKSAKGSKVDLKTGEQVGVFGSTNPDGSVTAQDVQINPSVRAVLSRTPQQ